MVNDSRQNDVLTKTSPEIRERLCGRNGSRIRGTAHSLGRSLAASRGVKLVIGVFGVFDVVGVHGPYVSVLRGVLELLLPCQRAVAHRALAPSS